MSSITPELSEKAAALLARGRRFRAPLHPDEIAALLLPTDGDLIAVAAAFEERFGGIEYTVRGNTADQMLLGISSEPEGVLSLPGRNGSAEPRRLIECGRPFAFPDGEPARYYLDAQGAVFHSNWRAAGSFQTYFEAEALLDALMDVQPEWVYGEVGLFDHGDTIIDDYVTLTCGASLVPEASDSNLMCWANERLLVMRSPGGPYSQFMGSEVDTIRVWVRTLEESEALFAPIMKDITDSNQGEDTPGLFSPWPIERPSPLYAAPDGGRVFRVPTPQSGDAGSSETETELSDLDQQNQAMQEAVIRGDVAQVRQLIAAGADFTTADDNGRTALMLAAIHAQPEMLRFLLEHGADVHAKDEDGNTALMFLAMHRWYQEDETSAERAPDQTDSPGFAVQSASVLLEYGADVNSVDEDGTTVLMTAAEARSPALLRFLLDHGADLEAKNVFGGTSLMFAARSTPPNLSGGDDVEGLALLLERGANTEVVSEAGDTALTFAAARGAGGNVRVLLEHGASLVPPPGYPAELKLMLAVFGGMSDNLRARIRRSRPEDIDARSDCRRSALMWAAELGYTEVVELLLDHGALIDGQDQNGWTALLFASYRGHEACVKLLLERGASVHSRGRDGWADLDVPNSGRNALEWSLYGKRSEAVVSTLLRHGVSMDIRDGGASLLTAVFKGSQALVQAYREAGHAVDLGAAVWLSDTSLVQTLLAEGADVNIPSPLLHDTPLLIAVKQGNVEIVRLLLDHGASPQSADDAGLTPLIAAKAAGREDIIRLFLDENRWASAND